MARRKQDRDGPRVFPGRHGASPDLVAGDQRRRLLEAAAAVIGEQGIARATIAAIVERAGVSRSTFYEQFANKDECFLAVYDDAMERLCQRVDTGVTEAEGWPEQVRAGIEAMLSFFSAEPHSARICALEAPLAAGRVAERYREAMPALLAALRLDERSTADFGATATSGKSVLEGILWLIAQHVLAGEADRLADLAPQLVEFATAPYAGSPGATTA